jgi:hypothetical protein
VASLNRFLDILLESSCSPAKIAKRIESSGLDSRNRTSTSSSQVKCESEQVNMTSLIFSFRFFCAPGLRPLHRLPAPPRLHRGRRRTQDHLPRPTVSRRTRRFPRAALSGGKPGRVCAHVEAGEQGAHRW